MNYGLLVATSNERQHLKFPSEFATDLLTLNLVSRRSPVAFVVSSEITENDVYFVGFCFTKLSYIYYQESLSIHSLQRLPVTTRPPTIFSHFRKLSFGGRQSNVSMTISLVHFVSVSRPCSIVVGLGLIAQFNIMTKSFPISLRGRVIM